MNSASRPVAAVEMFYSYRLTIHHSNILSSMNCDDFSVVIYGLFDLRGKCMYVGQTLNAESREHQHLYERASKFYGKHLVFRIIRETNCRNANRLECQIGRAYKRRGQASKSKSFRGAATQKPPPRGIEIFADCWPKPFRSVTEAAKVLNSSPATILNCLRGSKLLTFQPREGKWVITILDTKPIGLTWDI